MEVTKRSASLTEMARCLVLVETFCKAAFEVLSMLDQYFLDIVEHEVEEARQMAFFVEQCQDAVYSTSYHSAREAVTAKLEVENSKQLAKALLERSINNRGKGGFLSDGTSTLE